jgi:predicted AlkP superfamily pyrophosphatase or phosphodiesterase
MRPLRQLLLVLATCLGLASPALAKPDLLILVSIDGFRADYIDRGVTPILSALGREGVLGSMRPAFPSLTFPNHYTLVTGLYPDHNGIVDNTMDDPQLGHFTMAHSIDPRWWNEAEPLWVTADAQGLKTATMFWPGSDREIRGQRPDYWLAYDKHFLADQRVDQVLKWLDLPPDERPNFVTLYFDLVDTVGHRAGPDDKNEIDAALRSTDASLGRLVEGLKARGLLDHANLIVVADHGMAEVSPDRVLYLDSVLSESAFKTITSGPVMGLSLTINAPKDALDRLRAIRGHARCWPKAEIPPQLHYGSNARVPPIVCLADPGWLIATHALAASFKGEMEKGAHGYDPADPRMAALFLAHGPAFEPGAHLEAFDNVDVHPLMARLLGLKIPPGDGTADIFTPVLAH